MISGRDVIVISNVDWEPLWQAPQEIATRFGENGNRVVFVENTGVRSPRPRDAGRVLGRLAQRARAVRHEGVLSPRPGVRVHSPLVLPPFGSRARRALNRRLLVPALARVLRRLEFRDPLVITFLPTDTMLALYERVRTPASRLVYWRLADFAELTPHSAELRASEDRLAASADVLLAQNDELAERLVRHADVEVQPPSVDLDAFSPDATPIQLGMGPVIGYLGGLHRHVDVALLEGMADLRPEWSLVIVGPLQRSCAGLLARPNVRHVGARPHGELASYVAAFDVGIVPYLKNVHTDTVVPAKVGEYLAMGKPVVATDLPGVRPLATDPGVLRIADPAPASFVREVDAAMSASGPEHEVARRSVAAGLDWVDSAARLSDLIEAIYSQPPAAQTAAA
jgi:glycosyltransferase involved in cell wall biosynthesis